MQTCKVYVLIVSIATFVLFGCVSSVHIPPPMADYPTTPFRVFDAHFEALWDRILSRIEHAHGKIIVENKEL